MSITVPETFTIGGDLTIRRLGFGAMRLTGPGIIGEPLDREGANLENSPGLSTRAASAA